MARLHFLHGEHGLPFSGPDAGVYGGKDGAVAGLCGLSVVLSPGEEQFKGPDDELQAKILFGFSITLSSTQLIVGLMMLLVKWSVLKKHQAEEAQDLSATAASLELGDMYDLPVGEDGDGRRKITNNPMHEAAIKERASLIQRINTMETENRELRTRLDVKQEQEQEQIVGGSIGRRDMSIPSVTARQDHGARRRSQELRLIRSLMTPIPIEMRGGPVWSWSTRARSPRQVQLGWTRSRKKRLERRLCFSLLVNLLLNP